MKRLFLSWHNPVAGRWFPIGCLESSDALYSFVYTKGAKRASEEAGFLGLPSFPEWHTVYVSEQLFPLFSNRVLPRSRPGFREYLGWLGLGDTDGSPVVQLSRSGGSRITDTMEVFPSPEPNDQGEYEIYFPVDRPFSDRAVELKPGEALLPMWDLESLEKPDAIALRVANTLDPIGYSPRYLGSQFDQLAQWNLPPAITVERVNPPPAPLQLRVLAKAVMRWPEGRRPFDTEEYEPLVTLPVVAGAPRISLPPRRHPSSPAQ